MNAKEAKHCVKLFERYRYCEDRALAADGRSRQHPGTVTADREQSLASRWEDKAQLAWNEAITILNKIANEE